MLTSAVSPDSIDLVEQGGTRGAAPTNGSAHAKKKEEKLAEPADLIISQAGAKKANITKNAERG